MEVVCEHCGKRFNRSPSLIRNRVFCSRECRSAFARPELVCPGCGKTFIRNPHNARQYCSWECFKQSRWEIVKCAMCDKEYQKRVSEIKKAKENGHLHMCSRNCRNKYTSFLLGGDGTWVEGGRYKKYGEPRHWRKQRMAAIERDNYKCQHCGESMNLEVHHWEPYWISQDNSLDNLVTLCRSCHKDVHDMYMREGFYEDVYREMGR